MFNFSTVSVVIQSKLYPNCWKQIKAVLILTVLNSSVFDVKCGIFVGKVEFSLQCSKDSSLGEFVILNRH